MKSASLIPCLILAVSSTRAENVILDRIYFHDKGHMDFLVPGEELRKLRAWEPSVATDAPLSRDQALEIAGKAAAAEGLDMSDRSKLVITLTKTNLAEESLIKKLPPGCCLWFYLVDFKGKDSAMKGKFTFLVSMSGAIALKQSVPGR